MRVVRSFSTEDKEREHFGKETLKAYAVGKKRALLYGIFSGIGMVLAFGIILAILWYGGNLVLNGDLSVG
jgi:ABC-type bacteriocin/lantibiotic exporter with double-glycine peptidase domain